MLHPSSAKARDFPKAAGAKQVPPSSLRPHTARSARTPRMGLWAAGRCSNWVWASSASSLAPELWVADVISWHQDNKKNDAGKGEFQRPSGQLANMEAIRRSPNHDGLGGHGRSLAVEAWLKGSQ